ncbi:hypothetical protein HDU87_008353, partial [Geranomyces variabilis]
MATLDLPWNLMGCVISLQARVSSTLEVWMNGKHAYPRKRVSSRPTPSFLIKRRTLRFTRRSRPARPAPEDDNKWDSDEDRRVEETDPWFNVVAEGLDYDAECDGC